MMKFFKSFLLSFFLFSTVSELHAKPIPPGAGQGDVSANILFLVDSSDSMHAWIGGEGLEPVHGAFIDKDDNIVISQWGHQRGITRYTPDGRKDSTFTDIQFIGSGGCANRLAESNDRRNRKVRRNGNVNYVQNLTMANTDINGENLIFFRAWESKVQGNVFAYSENGDSCRLVIGIGLAKAKVHRLKIKTISNVPYLFITGQWRNGGFLKVVNLNTQQSQTTTDCRTCRYKNLDNFDISNDGSLMYIVRGGDFFTLPLVLENGAYRNNNPMITSRCDFVNSPNLDNQMMHVKDINIDPQDNNIAYISSYISHSIQKINPSTCAVETYIGKGVRSRTANSGDPGSLQAELVGFSNPLNIFVGEDKILVPTMDGYVDVIDKSKFTVAARDEAWQLQFGGPRVKRWDGVKAAIDAVVNDSTLTTGAYFGFGHWNAGEVSRRKNGFRGGYYCHTRSDCKYYINWKGGQHPNGTSQRCNTNSCLNIAVSPRGASKIMGVFSNLQTAWGTDAQAFSQIARKYFEDEKAGKQLLPPEGASEETKRCLLNYVIVIGDGAMKNTGTGGQRGSAKRDIEILRDRHNVKTLFVAYGDGIKPGPMTLFEQLAVAGSCPGGQAGHPDCHALMKPVTPEALKQELSSKIRQILADKLAFTAPSITASIQEGGSLYQAQFEYMVKKEWQGTILRHAIDKDGNVNMAEANTSEGQRVGNWNAAEKIKSQSTPAGTVDERKIWSTIEGVPYAGNWDNFNAENSGQILNLMESTGYAVRDYHNSNSEGCPGAGQDGITDDAIGLINFMKGTDYFAYHSCDISAVRQHVLGDIYHSQLIEVGPPDSSLDFIGQNEESYFRFRKNYANFITKNKSRPNVVYAGSNTGMLHAICSGQEVTSACPKGAGSEMWGFIPPFVATNLPQIINKDYDKKDTKGGTNPIFGVDGSPIVHDAFIKGFKIAGDQIEPDDVKRWRTILFVPYGRGGAGFSVLDVTDPVPSSSTGPIHMFSIFNDQVNNKVLVADANGRITDYEYNAGSSSSSQSLEGLKAYELYTTKRDADEAEDPPVTTRQDAAAQNCITDNTNYGFDDSIDSTCYSNRVYHFPGIELPFSNGQTIPPGLLTASLRSDDGTPQPLGITKAIIEQGMLQVTFNKELIVNPYQREDSDPNTLEGTLTDRFGVRTSCKGGSGFNEENMHYNYSQLGETWATPRIAKIPMHTSPGNSDNDVYVAILPGGMTQNNTCAGSALFMVSLEEIEDDGRIIPAGGIYAANINMGPISIVDTSPAGYTVDGQAQPVPTPNGSDIVNAIPATPVIITPDTAAQMPWRGAMVYVNDLEGKITKINLTSQSAFDAGLFDQTTLFRLDANQANARYSYFGMEAGIGASDQKFYLFGGTGNFQDLGGKDPGMDNILYGFIDEDFPFYKDLNGGKVPLGLDQDFENIALQLVSKSRSIDNTNITPGICVDATGNVDENSCLNKNLNQTAWVIGLDRPEARPKYKPSNPGSSSPILFRKASAPPTLHKGKVYFPVYQPPPGVGCAQGSAFICVADDECGTNGSAQLDLEDPPAELNVARADTNNMCGYVRQGILSELVVFADQLFANVAGPSEGEKTLFQILSLPGDVITNKGGWRDSSF